MMYDFIKTENSWLVYWGILPRDKELDALFEGAIPEEALQEPAYVREAWKRERTSKRELIEVG
jgi:hypothetical protein